MTGSQTAVAERLAAGAGDLLQQTRELDLLVRQADKDRPRSADNQSPGTLWSVPRTWQPNTTPAYRQALADLAHAHGFIAKCVRDLPRAKGMWPSREQAHSCCVRLFSIARDLKRILAVLAGTAAPRRIIVATHAKPDLDALVGVWLVERYLHQGPVDVVFAQRSHNFITDSSVDCVVDMGGLYEPTLGLFDHKPPSFADRRDNCAASLVWQHARVLGRPVEHLASLIEAVHAGDSRRFSNTSYRISKSQGLHRFFAGITEQSDQAKHKAVKRWLDRTYGDGSRAT